DVSLRRALFVAAFIVLWMFAIGVRLVHLQVSMHDQLSDRALNQQQGMIETGFERGQLSDREGRQLARSIETESIFVAPDEVKDVAIASQLIADSLGADKATLAKQISEAQVAKKRFLWIARRVPHEQAQKIADCNVDGVHLQKEAKRYYPNGSLAAHVLGFVGLDNNGQAGIEQFYNQKISGEPGKLFLQRDSHGRVYHSFAFESKPGQNIVLTIDQMIQYRAEQALAEAVQSSHANSGTAIVLDPKSGEILALANAPSFDPNTPGTAKSETRINQALEYVYEPGSTFKIVAFSAALEKGLIKPDDRIDCQMGAITVSKRVIHDHHPFGVLTATEALEKSSNVAAIKLGVK